MKVDIYSCHVCRSVFVYTDLREIQLVYNYSYFFISRSATRQTNYKFINILSRSGYAHHVGASAIAVFVVEKKDILLQAF